MFAGKNLCGREGSQTGLGFLWKVAVEALRDLATLEIALQG